MIGQPKFKKGDLVAFDFGKNNRLIGEVCVVDKWGTFEDPSDVSYDIFVKEDNCIYKHIREDFCCVPSIA